MSRTLLAIFLCLSMQGAPQSPDAFEVAVLKPSQPRTRFSSTSDGAQFRGAAHTLMQLIQSAYADNEIQPWMVQDAPAWVTTDLWDLTAKLPAGMPTEQQALYRRTEAMLRTFLAEEFGLATHREKRDFPVYALVIGRNGLKLKPTQAAEFGVKMGRGRLDFRHLSMETLARFLHYPNFPGYAVDRPVIDKTGLTGFFDITLEWTPETVEYDPAATAPSLFTAIEQQLGLKLQPQKEPVEFLVIDRVQRPAPVPK